MVFLQETLSLIPEADCVIMTTEILRNALFQQEADSAIDISLCEPTKQSLSFEMDLQRDLACVIFDEIHYINDADRGKVWEETIIKLPQHVHMVMLSATIDRPEEFADWIERTKQVPVWFTSTNTRVVPLTHYSYFTIPRSLYKRFQDDHITSLMRSVDDKLIPLQHNRRVFIPEPYHVLQKITKYMTKHNIIYTKHILCK